MTHAGGDMPATTPTLSVVIPVYNVEQYLDECLESVRSQEIASFEAIMVDDGSTDRSREIAAQWVERDSRFRLVTQTNHGLGHARNTGAQHVAGKYIAFLDSDDVVPKQAYAAMIKALERSGSDFATGNVHRFNSTGRTWQAAQYKGMMLVEQLGTHVSKQPELLHDHLAHNKVWRTSFWKSTGLAFPVGVLYEDIPTIIPAHVNARAVDVVPVVAVFWRLRDRGDKSITQHLRTNPANTRDRMAAVLSNSRFLSGHSSQLKEEYDSRVLLRDIPLCLDLYTEVDESYRQLLISSVEEFLSQASPDAMRRAPVGVRVPYHLLVTGKMEALEEFIKMRRARILGELPVTFSDDRARLEVDLPGVVDLPDEIVDMTDELVMASRVSDIEVTDSDLIIRGWANIARLSIDDPDEREIAVWLERESERLPAMLEYGRDDRAKAWAGVSNEESGKVVFTARVPLKSLKPHWPARGASWVVMGSVRHGAVTRTARLASPIDGPAQRAHSRRLRGSTWFRVYWSSAGLMCTVRREAAVLEAARASDARLELTIRSSGRITRNARLMVRMRDAKDVTRTYRPTDLQPFSRVARFVIPVDTLPSISKPVDEAGASSGTYWQVFFRRKKAERSRGILAIEPALACAVIDGERETALRGTRSATLGLVQQPAAAVLRHASWRSGATLEVRLRYDEDLPAEAVVLSAGSQIEHVAFPTRRSGDEISAELAVGEMPRFGETVPLRAGTWTLALRTPAGDIPVKPASEPVKRLPIDTLHRGRTFSLVDKNREKVVLVSGLDLRPADRGKPNQTWLETVHYPASKSGLRDAVLYESYSGQQFSDSPRQIFSELRSRGSDLEHLVVVRDQQVTVPDGATAVPYRSREYFEALAQARFIVSNNHLLSRFRRAEGQVVVQTWHGVGTKKIGLDLDTVHFANRAYNDKLKSGEAQQWDYLISPNSFTSPILRRAFAFTGTLLETGVPRNDVFYRPERDELIRQVRRRLGVPEGQRIVMYAPTWRDNVHDGPGKYRLDLRFDLYEASRKLGDDYIFLFRKHSNITDRLPAGVGNVIDASDYPDVQELLLVADILISDYSTLMCDFANTGRPMIFYTYDLTNYRDVLRGFYFDFEDEVPGPLITNEVDLLPAIQDADQIRVAYDEKYKRFADRFCHWDDGKAASRVVDAVFGID